MTSSLRGGGAFRPVTALPRYSNEAVEKALGRRGDSVSSTRKLRYWRQTESGASAASQATRVANSG